MLQARPSKALKDKYTNIKTVLRKQFAAEKASRKATGGGEEMPEWRPQSDAMNDLANLISISIRGTSPNFDDDDDIESPPVESFDVESIIVQSSAVEKPDDLSNHEIIEYLQEDDDEQTLVIAENPLPSTSSEPASSKSWSKYTPSMLRKPNSSKLKRPTSAASSRSGEDDSLQSLKIKLVERELEMREMEHQTRLCQQQKEHEARMGLLEVQKLDFATKIEMRRLKIAKILEKKNDSESEPDSE